jgi:hypothetical protein
MTKNCFLRQLYTFGVLIIILLLITQTIFAQSPLTAEVDRTSLSTDDYLTLTVVVRSDSLNPPDPVLPPLDGFEVIGRSSSSQISVVNTQVSIEATTTYRLHPTQTGQLTIGAAGVEMNGQTYTTEPITVQVSAGSVPQSQTGSTGGPSAPAPSTLSGQDFFVEAAVDLPGG